jgi:hypothetical protein
MTFNLKSILGIAALVVASLAIGRYTAPKKESVRIEERIVEKEVIKWKESKKTDEQKNIETIVIETKFPDGTIKTETRTVDKGRIVIDQTKQGEKISDRKTDLFIRKDSGYESQWKASALISSSHKDSNLLRSDLSYGASIERKVAGPFSVGAFGLTNQTYGLSVGISW